MAGYRIIMEGEGMKRIITAVIASLLMITILTGCNNSISGTSGKSGQTVKIGIMPDVDSLPFIVAKEAGFFKDFGVNVELIMFKGAPDRDSAFQSGNVDGVVSDLLAAIFAVNGGFDVKITSHTDGRYIFLASSQSGAKKVTDLKGKEIGLSNNTIIEYSIDAMLKSAGLKPEDIKKIPISQIPVRLEMLKSGKLGGACLPDPLATLAEESGAVAVGDTSKTGNTLGTVLFSKKSIDEKRSEITKVYEAYERAKEELNRNGDKYRPILVDKGGFPEGVKDVLKFPQYKKSYLPSEDDFESVYKWIMDKGLVKKNVDYNTIIAGEFIK